jgi:hypothetical protein
MSAAPKLFRKVLIFFSKATEFSNMVRILTLLGAALVVIACNETKEESSEKAAITADRLLAFQAKRAEATPIDAARFKSTFADSFGYRFTSDHYEYEDSEDSSDSDGGSTSESCFQKSLDTAMSVETDGNRLTISAVVQQDPACLAIEKAAAEAMAEEFGMGFYSDTTSASFLVIFDCANDMSGRTK